jgi:uncharacterized SAM-binding protein YcdF (DUF218 family)
MAKPTQFFLIVLTAAGVLLAAGFAVFMVAIRNASEAMPPAADAIVVLTGGEDRIAAGMELLKEQRGRRLLISGVNARTGTPSELRRSSPQEHELRRCCVDIGREALDTSGNAEEAREWAEQHGFKNLIVVTSSYHMPRTLTEFARAMPHTSFTTFSVATRHYRLDSWWEHPATVRLLVSEYLKFLASAARLGLSRVWGLPVSQPRSEHQPMAARSAL